MRGGAATDPGDWTAPEIFFNTDQGAPLTREAVTGVRRPHHLRISMEGRGRCWDNILGERLWRSLKLRED